MCTLRNFVFDLLFKKNDIFYNLSGRKRMFEVFWVLKKIEECKEKRDMRLVEMQIKLL